MFLDRSAHAADRARSTRQCVAPVLPSNSASPVGSPGRRYAHPADTKCRLPDAFYANDIFCWTGRHRPPIAETGAIQCERSLTHSSEWPNRDAYASGKLMTLWLAVFIGNNTPARPTPRPFKAGNMTSCQRPSRMRRAACSPQRAADSIEPAPNRSPATCTGPWVGSE